MSLNRCRTIVVQSEIAVDYDSTLDSASQMAAEGAASAEEAAENQGYNLYILAGHEAMQL